MRINGIEGNVTYSAAERALWMDDGKRDHKTKHRDQDNTNCPTAETLLVKNLNVKTLTREEEVELLCRYQEETDPNEKAMIRDEFLTRNCRLCMHLATQKSQKCSATPKELMGYAVEGMIRAFEKYDLSKGAKFSTYAIYWINQAMTRGLAESERMIRAPYNVITDAGKMTRFVGKYSIAHGHEPSDQVICENFEWTQEKLDYTRKCLTQVSSIDIPAADSEDTIADLIEDSDTSIEGEVCDNDLHTTLMNTLAESLEPRAYDILCNLRQLPGFPCLTQEQLAEKYGITKERVLQIQAESISILRHPSKSSKLRSFYTTI